MTTADSDPDQVLVLRRHETADAFVTELNWKPKVKSTGPFRAGPTTTLDVHAVLTAPKAQPDDVTRS